MTISIEKRLEQYTLQHPQEVLLVAIEVGKESDQILIFKGFSSSLVRPTAADPDVPVLPDDATIIEIDRLAGPYQPNCPNYLERHITWDDFFQRLINP